MIPIIVARNLQESKMFSLETVALTPGKMEARKQVRFHRSDVERISSAAGTMGIKVADFIRQAALLHAQDIEQRLTTSNLPIEVFEDFTAAVNTQGRLVPGLMHALRRTRDILKTQS